MDIKESIGLKPVANLDFGAINAAALAALPALLSRWLPDGHVRGVEYVARNPTRADRRPGSFKINIRTGRWRPRLCRVTEGQKVADAAELCHAARILVAQGIIDSVTEYDNEQ